MAAVIIFLSFTLPHILFKDISSISLSFSTITLSYFFSPIIISLIKESRSLILTGVLLIFGYPILLALYPNLFISSIVDILTIAFLTILFVFFIKAPKDYCDGILNHQDFLEKKLDELQNKK